MTTSIKTLEKNRLRASVYYYKNKEAINQKKKEYYYSHKDEIYAKRKEYYKNRYLNKKYEIQKKSRIFHKERRDRIIKYLGGKCVRCGFNDNRALQVDHINGGGLKERRDTPHFCNAKFENMIYSDTHKYQLLCANCNNIKKYENGEFFKK
jgi:hypothetical protein